MQRRSHHRSVLREALLALAFVAMAMRALVPGGYMLAETGAGHSITVTICSGQGPIEGHISLGQQAPDHRKNAGSHEPPCAYSAVAHLAAPQAAPDIGPTLQPTLDLTPASLGVRPALELAAPPPWATGPPLTA